MGKIDDYVERLKKEAGLGPTGDYPEGKFREDDEGGLLMAVGHMEGKVVVAFGHGIEWLALPPEKAIEFGHVVIDHAHKLITKKGGESGKSGKGG